MKKAEFLEDNGKRFARIKVCDDNSVFIDCFGRTLTERQQKIVDMFNKNLKKVEKVENKIPIDENKKLVDENKKLIGENKKLIDENKKLIGENKKLKGE